MDSCKENAKSTQKETFYRQQQHRLQHIAINKDLSADDLIKNILDKVDTDAKITKLFSAQHKQTAGSSTHALRDNETNAQFNVPTTLPIPHCLLKNSEIPSIYVEIWQLVKSENSADLCERDKLYQVLLLSNLSSNVLAQLWTFVNRTIPGQLTRNELFIMLGLIALVQQNFADPTNELYRCLKIPVPIFNNFFQADIKAEIEQVQDKAINYTKTNHIQFDVSTSQSLPNSVAESVQDTVEDEFSEFKSANCIASDEISNVQTILPNLDDIKYKFSNSSSEEFQQDLFSNTITEFKVADNQESCLSLNNNSEILQTQNDLLSPVEEVSSQNTDDHSIPISTIKDDKNDNLRTDDKYSSLRKLSLNLTDNDEFGDFYCHSEETEQNSHIIQDNLCSNQFTETVDQINSVTESVKEHWHNESKSVSNKRKLLNACKQVMQKTFNNLIVNHGEDSVLEAFRSKDGTNFAYDLFEVYNISKRINLNVGILHNTNESKLCNELFVEIDNKWNFVNNIFKKCINEFSVENPEPLDNSESENLSDCRCMICSDICYDKSSSLLFAGFLYHTSCANFWLNYVNSSLPHKHFDDEF